MDKVVHFELPANDLSRAKKFYKETFGWQLQDMPEMNYVLAQSVAVDEKTHMPKEAGAINGGFLKKNNIVAGPSFAINVDNIDRATEKIKKSGGTIVQEKVAVGDMGFLVYFKDTEGNVLSIWQSAR
jgi:predicted enzyme related to lactoylglutathione lyase